MSTTDPTILWRQEAPGFYRSVSNEWLVVREDDRSKVVPWTLYRRGPHGFVAVDYFATLTVAKLFAAAWVREREQETS